MKQSLSRSNLVGRLSRLAACGLLAAAVPVAAPASPASEQSVDQAVRGLLGAQAEAWNHGDLEEFLEGYWRSPELTFLSDADRHSGWEQVRSRYLRRYGSSREEMGDLRFEDVEVVPLGAEAALARGRYVLLRGGQTATGLFTLVLRRLDGTWRIIHDHTST